MKNAHVKRRVVVPALVVLITVITVSQSPQYGVSVAGEVLRLGMERREALHHFSNCCNTIPWGGDAVIVQNKANTNDELGGTVYFERERVRGIAADKYWSPEPASFKTAMGKVW